MKRKPVPVEEKKPDTSKSVEVAHELIERQRVMEQKLFPLRIDQRIVIYVSREKCNEAYRQEYLKRMGEVKKEACPTKGMSPRNIQFCKKDMAEKIVELYKQGMPAKDITAELGVSRSTCCKYISKYKRES